MTTQQTAVKQPKSKRLGLLLRVSMTLVLVAVLVYGVDWMELRDHLSRASWLAIMLALVGLTAQFAISAWKWQYSLRIHQLHFGFGYLLKTLGIGFFFNHFLPSGIGGDAYRVVKTLPSDGFASRAVSAVVVDRLVGFAVLMVFGAVGALVLSDDSYPARAYLLACCAGTVVLFAVMYAVRRGWLKPLTDRVRHTKPYIALEHNIGHLRRAKGEWVPLIGISVLFQALAIAIIYCLFEGLRASAGAAESAVIAAVSGIATVIPVAINGIGIVEGSFAGVGAALNVGYESSLVAAILIRVLVIPHALLFGAMYALRGGSKANQLSTEPAA